MDIVALVIGGTAAMGSFATAGAIVGGARGRHAAGALWAMLLGPVGLVIAATLEPEIATEPRSEDALGPGVGKAKATTSTSRGTLGDGMR